MPEVKNCKMCKRMFQYVSGSMLCPTCKQLDEQDFDKVREFLRDFPGATTQEVSDNTEVSPTKIHRWLKEGRLEVSETSPMALNCESCSVRIRSGRFCVECSKSLARDMMNEGKKLQETLNSNQSSSKQTKHGDNNDFGLLYKHRDKK